MAQWGYGDRNGPSTWAEHFPEAAGSKQSPVDINPSETSSDTSLRSNPLNVRYPSDKTLKLQNTGHGWKVSVDGEESELTGGPLEGVYKLEQFHCHWGGSSDKGSEHTLDGQAYAGELHLVHYNSSKYGSFAEASTHPDGLAVLGVFLKAGEHHHEIQKISSQMKQIKYSGAFIESPGDIDPYKFLPEEKGYWTYQGSLTTPPCTESVTWIVFKQPIEVSEKQLQKFRRLKNYKKDSDSSDEEHGRIVDNFRPPLPLGNRVLRECGSF